MTAAMRCEIIEKACAIACLMMAQAVETVNGRPLKVNAHADVAGCAVILRIVARQRDARGFFHPRIERA